MRRSRGRFIILGLACLLLLLVAGFCTGTYLLSRIPLERADQARRQVGPGMPLGAASERLTAASGFWKYVECPRPRPGFAGLPSSDPIFLSSDHVFIYRIRPGWDLGDWGMVWLRARGVQGAEVVEWANLVDSLLPCPGELHKLKGNERR